MFFFPRCNNTFLYPSLYHTTFSKSSSFFINKLSEHLTPFINTEITIFHQVLHQSPCRLLNFHFFSCHITRNYILRLCSCCILGHFTLSLLIVMHPHTPSLLITSIAISMLIHLTIWSVTITCFNHVSCIINFTMPVPLHVTSLPFTSLLFSTLPIKQLKQN